MSLTYTMSAEMMSTTPIVNASCTAISAGTHREARWGMKL